MTQGASNDDSNHLLQFTYTAHDYEHNTMSMNIIYYEQYRSTAVFLLKYQNRNISIHLYGAIMHHNAFINISLKRKIVIYIDIYLERLLCCIILKASRKSKIVCYVFIARGCNQWSMTYVTSSKDDCSNLRSVTPLGEECKSEWLEEYSREQRVEDASLRSSNDSRFHISSTLLFQLEKWYGKKKMKTQVQSVQKSRHSQLSHCRMIKG